MREIRLVLLPLLASALALRPHPLFALVESQTPKNVNKVLRGNIEDVDARHLLKSLPLRPDDLARAEKALLRQGATAFVDGVLSEAEAASLRTWGAKHMLSAVTGAASTEIDSVDGAPAHQVDVPSLGELLGRDARDRLLGAAAAILGARPGDATAFVRKYSPSSRPRLGFHCDGCDASISVNLSAEDGYAGGDLLLLADGAVVAAPRGLGGAAAHDADVAHAVGDVTSGERWSLVVFTHRRADWRTSEGKAKESRRLAAERTRGKRKR